jgi:hypothetical protein
MSSPNNAEPVDLLVAVHDETSAADDVSMITLILSEDTQLVCLKSWLMQHFDYFQTLFHGAYSDSDATVLHLTCLDARVVRTLLEEYPKMRHDEMLNLWKHCDDDAATESLIQALDYLQMKLPAITLQADKLLYLGYMGGLRRDCQQQGYCLLDDDNHHYTVIRLPTGKKKRTLRFWVCVLLCLEIFPAATVTSEERPTTTNAKRVDDDDTYHKKTTTTSAATTMTHKTKMRLTQPELMDRLQTPAGGPAAAIDLRRELIEAGLLEREADGSAYWRPVYTARRMEQWVRKGGANRKVV